MGSGCPLILLAQHHYPCDVIGQTHTEQLLLQCHSTNTDMEEHLETASDLVPLASGSASYPEPVDDPAMFMDLIIDYPFESAQCGACKGFFTKPSIYIQHMEDRHGKEKVRFRCSKCGLSKWRSNQSVACHFPKCKGAEPPDDHLIYFACSRCPAKFRSASGRSQHERHEHISLRNAKRLQAMEPAPTAKRRGRKNYLWSTAQEVVLVGLLKESMGNSSKLKELTSAQLPGFTWKQVLAKKRCFENNQFAGKEILSKGVVTSPDGNPRNSPEPRREVNAGDARLCSQSESNGSATCGGEGQAEMEELAESFGEASSVGVLDMARFDDSDDPGGDENPRWDKLTVSELASLMGDSDTVWEDELIMGVDLRQVLAMPTSAAASPPSPILRPDSGEETEVEEPDWISIGGDNTSMSDPETEEQGALIPALTLNLEPTIEADVVEYQLSTLRRALALPCPDAGDGKEMCLALDILIRDALDGRSEQASLDRYVEYILVPMLKGDAPEAKKPRADRERRPKGARPNKEGYLFARHQDLFKREPGKLARMLISNDFSETDAEQDKLFPTDESVRALYERLWGTPWEDTLTLTPSAHPTMSSSIRFLTPAMIRSRIKAKLKKKSAGGTDGLTKADLCRVAGIETVLAKLYNFLFATKLYPNAWRENRTTLLPKPNKDRREAASWRPITVSSILSRLQMGLLDAEVRRMVHLSERQKGFVGENGCASNIFILTEVLKYMKKQKGGVLVQIDLKQAFDTVPHSILRKAQLHSGMHPYLVDYIMGTYEGARTTIKGREGGITIPFRRGVKQGDPYSPEAFNIVLDPLIRKLSSLGKGVDVGGEKIAVLAFADDLMLLGANRVEAQALMDCAQEYFAHLGMGVSIGKCATFEIVTGRKTSACRDPEITITGSKIPYCKVSEFITYLGHNISPLIGLQNKQVFGNLVSSIERVKKLKLKPYQKVELLSRYVLPHFLHGLLVGMPARTTLQQVDQKIRVVLRRCLHLPETSANEVLYARKRDGGLGFPRLEHLVPAAILKSGIRLRMSTDKVIRALYKCQGVDVRLQAMSKALALTKWPLELFDIRKAKVALKNKEHSNWGKHPVHGMGVTYFKNDPIGNRWLRNPTLLSNRNFCEALKLRTNTVGTRACLARGVGRAIVDVTCRRCHGGPETLGHVLGLCTETKGLRITRHDNIVQMVHSAVALTCPEATQALEQEFEFRPEPGKPKVKLKPDLVVCYEGEVFIVDVTVRIEANKNLEAAYQEKLDKYTPLLPKAQELMGATKGRVLPLVFGSRGAVLKSAVKNLKALGLNGNALAKRAAISNLDRSLAIWSAFLDYG